MGDKTKNKNTTNAVPTRLHGVAITDVAVGIRMFKNQKHAECFKECFLEREPDPSSLQSLPGVSLVSFPLVSIVVAVTDVAVGIRMFNNQKHAECLKECLTPALVESQWRSA